jgi:glucose/arabinose dehydrogenase
MRRVHRRQGVIGLVAAAMVAGCSGGSSGPAPEQPTAGSSTAAVEPSPSVTSTATRAPGTVPTAAVQKVLATGLDVPWGIAFLPDGSALIAERPTGRIVKLPASGGATTVVGTVPGVRDDGEGGLLGLAIAPDDPNTLFAYLSSTVGDNRVIRMPLDGGRLGPPTTVITGIPTADHHDGGRMIFGPDGNLWIGTGDAGDTGRSQDQNDLGGKILRLKPDGKVPADNPFPGSPVWSFGHRNVQGLAFDSAGRLWATEFGQNTWDELNRVVKGGNHGWPDIEGKGGRAGYVDPQVVWSTADASPSGLAIVDDVAYVAALRGQRLWQVPLTGGVAGKPKALFSQTYGRLRTVLAAPGGGLWLTTSNRDGHDPGPHSGDDKVLQVRLS